MADTDVRINKFETFSCVQYLLLVLSLSLPLPLQSDHIFRHSMQTPCCVLSIVISLNNCDSTYKFGIQSIGSIVKQSEEREKKDSQMASRLYIRNKNSSFLLSALLGSLRCVSLHQIYSCWTCRHASRRRRRRHRKRGAKIGMHIWMCTHCGINDIPRRLRMLAYD